MANPIRQAAVRRKAIYFGVLIGLFTVSIFWRGKLDPGGWVGRHTVAAQAARLDLREANEEDPRLGGSVIQVSVVGVRGPLVTALWWAAIEKQKRNEFEQFEFLVELVTKLQPNFISPWLFQSWNIAYNVSVENEKLGDMYYYIARGILLLADGDRVNTKLYTDPQGNPYQVGSPDIRYQIGFYYQNKFGVSDKVNTLRCLVEVSCIPPPDRAVVRDKKTGAVVERPLYYPSGGTAQGVDPAAFRKFCQDHPQLVRRLRTHLNLARPEDVSQFLVDNESIPSLYRPGQGRLADPGEQFPVLPGPAYNDGGAEYTVGPTGTPTKPMDDTFDAFLAARSWFGYAQTVIPPAKTDANGAPLPWAGPRPTEYDQFRHRMPRAPALVIFRQQPARAQTYLAERLQKEGWFDPATTWDPDEGSGGAGWFPRNPDGGPSVVLAPAAGSEANSQAQWQRAWTMWDALGRDTGLTLAPYRRQQLEAAAGVRGTPPGLPPDYTPEQMKALNLTPERLDAARALVYYEQNRALSNFPFFLASADAERNPLTVEARKMLWDAQRAEAAAQNVRAVRLYTVALAKWREVLARFPAFHRPERSDRTEEETAEYQIALVGLLRSDGAVRARTARAGRGASVLMPVVAAPEGGAADGNPLGWADRSPPAVQQVVQSYLQAAAEDEAAGRVAAEAVVNRQAGPDAQALVEKTVAEDVPALIIHPPAPGEVPVLPRETAAARAAYQAVMAAGGEKAPAELRKANDEAAHRLAEAYRPLAARKVVDADLWWMKEFMRKPVDRDPFGRYESSAYWVRPEVTYAVKTRLGLVRKPAQPAVTPGDAPPNPDAATTR